MTKTTIEFPPGLTRALREFAVKTGVLTANPHEYFQARGWGFQNGLVLIVPRLGGPVTRKVVADVLTVPGDKVGELRQLLADDAGALERSEQSGGDS